MCVYPALLTQQLLAAWQAAIECRAEEDAVLEPTPGVEWVPLDDTGKVYGPRAVKDVAGVTAGGTARSLSSTLGASRVWGAGPGSLSARGTLGSPSKRV